MSHQLLVVASLGLGGPFDDIFSSNFWRGVVNGFGASAAHLKLKSQKPKTRGYCHFSQNPNRGAFNKQNGN